MQFQKPAAHEALEQILWGLAALTAFFMVLSMPWVGPDKVIPGSAWLGFSLMGILVFSGGAIAVRVAFSHIGRDVDHKIDQEFQNFNR